MVPGGVEGNKRSTCHSQATHCQMPHCEQDDAGRKNSEERDQLNPGPQI